MKSNLKRIYMNKGNFDILNNRRYLIYSNPFYLVNRFIVRIDDRLNNNYLFNLKDLGIIDNDDNRYTSNYDYLYNVVSSSNSKSDVFALLHVASNKKGNNYTGIITKDGIGYGLNNGVTDYYTNLINGKRNSYPIEAIVAKVFDKILHKTLATCYFENNSFYFCNSLCLSESFIIDFMKKIDIYHDNYIELIHCYREKFEKERYYNNEIYGKNLKEKNIQLQRLYNKIHFLEKENYSIVYDIYYSLVDFIENSEIIYNEKIKLIEYINNEFNKLFCKEEFNYLSNLNNVFENVNVRKLVK